MRLDISRLAEGGKTEFREAWDPKTQDLDTAGLEYRGALEIAAIAERDAGIIRVRVVARAGRRMTCVRCLKEFDSALDKAFDFVYPVQQEQKVIVLDEDIRQELILDMPAQILCRLECRGLCARCGADLNDQKCNCD